MNGEKKTFFDTQCEPPENWVNVTEWMQGENLGRGLERSRKMLQYVPQLLKAARLDLKAPWCQCCVQSLSFIIGVNVKQWQLAADRVISIQQLQLQGLKVRCVRFTGLCLQIMAESNILLASNPINPIIQDNSFQFKFMIYNIVFFYLILIEEHQK